MAAVPEASEALRRLKAPSCCSTPAVTLVGAGNGEASRDQSKRTAKESQRRQPHVREAMAQDGAAMCEFYAWFEAALGHERITELTVDEQLSAARARRPGFVGLSFNTIAGFNANGAMPHYRATPESHAVIEGDGLLLIDWAAVPRQLQHHPGVADWHAQRRPET
jgi:Xaa-Pro aminopeptidase